MKIYVEELMELQRAQAMDIFWKDILVCPSEADYKDIIKKSITRFTNYSYTYV